MQDKALHQDLRRIITLYLTWLGFIGIWLMIFLVDKFPVRLSFVSQENLFYCVLEIKLFFILFIWPLFIPGILRSNYPETSKGKVHILLLQIVALLIFAFPLAMVCVNLSNTSVELFLKGIFVCLVMAIFVASVFNLASIYRFQITSWYYLFILCISCAPFLYYIGLEYFRSEWEGFLLASPFFVMLRLEGIEWIPPIAIFAIISCAFLLGAELSRKRVSI